MEQALVSKLGGRNKKRKTENPDDVVNDTGHHTMSASAMSQAESIWTLEAGSDARTPRYGLELGKTELKTLWKELRHNMSDCSNHSISPRPRLAAISSLSPASENDIRKWFQQLRHRIGSDGRPSANDSQLDFVEKVCDRLCVEIQEESRSASEATSEPLLWLLHGGPGTGKSHAIKLVHELFTEVMGWRMGVEFQTVALQAVMAEQLDGDTLHHAVGIPCFGQSEDERWEQKQTEVAQRVARWRWLIIDEISMISAKLLAQTDVKLRDTTRRLHTHKHAKAALQRAFGGLNVLFVGDFWQLPPPEGGNISSVPVELMLQRRIDQIQPNIAHGQYIFWGQGHNLSTTFKTVNIKVL